MDDALSFLAAANIDPYLIAALTASGIVAGAAATDALIGVVTEVGAVAGKTADVFYSDFAYVKLGATLAAGVFLTSDSAGRAVAAASGNRTIGILLEAGVANQICKVMLVPGVV